MSDVASEVAKELAKARNAHPAFHSAHEGYAVLLEEVDELWEHVKTNESKRDIHAMRKEAIQVAAMAIRFIVDVCDPEIDQQQRPFTGPTPTDIVK